MALDNNLTHFPTDIAMYRNNKYCQLYTSDKVCCPQYCFTQFELIFIIEEINLQTKQNLNRSVLSLIIDEKMNFEKLLPLLCLVLLSYSCREITPTCSLVLFQ